MTSRSSAKRGGDSRARRQLVPETFGLSDAELHCIEDRATRRRTQDAEAILAMCTQAINKGRRRFCTIGGGNHFLELQEIVDVLDQET